MASIASAPRYTTALPKAPPPTTLSSYQDALTRSPQDYSDIFNEYGDVIKNPSITPNSILTTPIQYGPSSDVSQSLGDLSNLAATGGYSPQDIADIRARGLSPIRAAFAAAQRNTNQQRALQGGYSPNYSAVQAKMARDQANSLAEQTTNINATLAQNIAQNKLSASSAYGSAASAEAARSLGASEFNAGQNLQGQEFNAGSANQAAENAQQRKLSAIEGQRGLYGTTPAQASLFGDQALRAAGINSNNTNDYLNRNLTGQRALIGAFA